MPYKDPEQQRKAQHDSYLRGKDRQIQYQRSVRAGLRQKVSEHKLERGCSRCGYDRNAAALDAHHPGGKTRIDSEVAHMVHQRKAWEAILAELVKCEILCANCHREEHSTRY